MPPTVIFGVQPGEISFNLELTTEVQKAIPRLFQLIEEEISTLTRPDHRGGTKSFSKEDYNNGPFTR